MKMKSENQCSSKEGFTLIEVIVAVVVLAILALPILAYFTNASVSASRGKSTQRASMVAQSVTEEIKSCTTFSQVENSLVNISGSGWAVDEPYDATTNQTILSKVIRLDGFDYVAKVELDYNYEPEDEDGNTIAAKYNSYPMPVLKEIYSSSNVVISETDQLSVALSNFLYYYPNETKSMIENGLTRTLCLDITKVGTASDAIARVRGYYEYEYKDAGTYEANIIDTKIEWAKFENVYFFYNLLNSTVEKEPVRITFNGMTSADAQQLHIYFVDQEVKGFTKPATYALDFSQCTGITQDPVYHTNGVPIESYAGTPKPIVTYDVSGKRIAKITVEVYDSNNMNEVITTLVTTKGA